MKDLRKNPGLLVDHSRNQSINAVSNHEDIEMKIYLHSAIGLLFTAGLWAGTAVASDQAGVDHSKHQGFLHDVHQAQLQHVAGADRTVDSVSRTIVRDQVFGSEGGVLNDVWNAHFSLVTTGESGQVAASTKSLPRDFLTDVRHSQFQHLDV